MSNLEKLSRRDAIIRKLTDLDNELVKESESAQFLNRLVCVSSEVALARFETLGAQVEDADTRYAKVVEETA